MNGDQLLFLWAGLILLAITGLSWIIFRKETSQNLPPGPWGCPILGNLLQMGKHPWKSLLKWKKTYGNIIYIRMGSFPAVVLNDAGLIREAFSLPALCGRPKFKIFVEYGQDKGLMTSDNPFALEQRQFLLKQLKRFEGRFVENVYSEISSLVKKIESQRGIPIQSSSIFPASIVNPIWKLFMGENMNSEDSQIKEFFSTVSNFVSPGPLASLGLLVPMLTSWFPTLMGYNQQLKAFTSMKTLMAGKLRTQPTDLSFDDVTNIQDAFLAERKAQANNPASSFHIQNDLLPSVMTEVFMAANDTTATALEWFLIFMTKNPECQDTFYREILEAIGGKCPPQLSDRSSFNFGLALIDEVFRFSTMIPLGGLHRALVDTPFHGYLIPRDTLIVANLYGVHMDVDTWSDPQNFRPLRFLDHSGKYKKSDQVLPFSVGRRRCLAESLARDQMFLYTINLVQKFKIETWSGSPPSLDYTVGMILTPKPTEIRFTPRLQV